MKNIMLFLIVIGFLGGCSSARKMVNRGDYDGAITKTVKKLKKKPNKEKQIAALSDAYRLANAENYEKINFLRKEGNPASWDDIYFHYSALQKRQDLIKTLQQNLLNKINFTYTNYDNELINAKQKAAEYGYTFALELLKTKNKADARKAYYELIKVKTFFQNYRDVDAQIQNALNAGKSNILFRMRNKTLVSLPQQFEEELLKTSLSEFNTLWLNFDSKAVPEKVYDYTILADIKAVNFSPESIKEKEFSESKVVDDGWEYKLDNKGNVMKDTSGNDIKIKKKKTISCYLKEVSMHKTVSVIGNLDFIENNNGQLIKSNPVIADALFDYTYLTATGDREALSPETKKKLKEPIPFPSTPEMIIQAVQTLKNIVKNVINSNKNLLY